MSFLFTIIGFLFGFYAASRVQNFYVRHQNPALPPPKTTLALGGGDRDLWQRLADAGFAVIKEERDAWITDIGAIKVGPRLPHRCTYCKSKPYLLAEVYQPPLPAGKHTVLTSSPLDAMKEYLAGDVPILRIDHVSMCSLGYVCEKCGSVSVWLATERSYGRLAPLLARGVNFFDVLDCFERVNGGDAEDAIGEGNLPFLMQRFARLEAELNEVQMAIMREKHKNGEGQAYREADRTLAPAVPEGETPPTDSSDRKTTP